jgi:tripartite-type tricarboxylate transporter receptor subunit TctC
MKRLFAALLLLPALAFAQAYPSKPVRLINPFPPGGTVDLIARMVQPKFQEFLGQSVIVENRGGAGGSVGTAEVSRAAPDGYTLLMVFDTHAVNHHIYKAAVDPFKTLDHIMLMVTSPSSMVAVSEFPAGNLRDIVAYAKANEGKVTYATAGAASSNHLAGLLFEQYAGVKMTHVHYKGGGPMIQALLGNQVSIAFMSTPLILPHIQSGKVKAIAVGARQRLSQLPNVPTLGETYPGFVMVSWFGILGPAGLPKEVTARIHREMGRTLQVPEVRDRLVERGFDIVASSPEEFLAFARGESEKYGKLIRDAGIRAE